MKKIKVKFKKISFYGQSPYRKHSGDAAYDLFAAENVFLLPGDTRKVATGIVIDIPEGYYAELHTRSSQGVQGIRCHLGIIDQDYHGEVFPIITTPIEYTIKIGERIAQLIFKERVEVDFIETIEEFESSRGTDGFGSTGK